jgi:hypothetical protein
MRLSSVEPPPSSNVSDESGGGTRRDQLEPVEPKMHLPVQKTKKRETVRGGNLLSRELVHPPPVGFGYAWFVCVRSSVPNSA